MSEREIDDLRRHWVEFCDADPFDGINDFAERMERAGLIDLHPVDDDDLEDAFASERGIHRGGFVWRLTDAARAILDLIRSRK